MSQSLHDSDDSAGQDGNPKPAGPPILEIDIKTPFGRLRGNLPVPGSKLRLSELAWNVMALDDRLVGMAVAAEAKQGRHVSCSKGCGACCRQAVPVSPAEAWMLADVVAALPPARKAEVLARFAAAWERLHAEGFAERSLSDTASENDVLRLGLDYFRLGIPCPFLEDESCSIHANRPSACREFLVTSPATNCTKPDELPTKAVPLAAGLTEGLSKLSALVLEAQPQVIPMTLALAWANDHHEEGQRRYDGGFLLTALVECLSNPGPQRPNETSRVP